MIWEYFYKVLKHSGEKLPLEHAVLIHGGGWKKLEAQAVDADALTGSMIIMEWWNRRDVSTWNVNTDIFM